MGDKEQIISAPATRSDAGKERSWFGKARRAFGGPAGAAERKSGWVGGRTLAREPLPAGRTRREVVAGGLDDALSS